MAKDRTPIVKRSRRLGIILGKSKYVQRRSYPPGMHGPKQSRGRPRLSSFGLQLMEKQKARAIFGVMEKQLRRYFDDAVKKQGDTSKELMRTLEMRLDNVVFRLSFAKTRPQACQMVNHRFIMVNGKSVNIRSYQVRVGDVVTIKENKQQRIIVKEASERIPKEQTPSWLSSDAATMTGKVTSLPQDEDLKHEFDPTLIVEFYSR